ncbi:hypothetical protein LPJ73_000223 [Coemansia sp. RSA 2703]|nr:hypothetical protein LPJ73_000223 [Coemansia sp. RSA 2703]
MRILSQEIRSNANWIDSLKTPEIRNNWIAEAREKLEEAAVKTMFDRLDFLATLQPKEGAKLGGIDYVWLSDTLVDSATRSSLKQLAILLENDSEHHNDFYPHKDKLLVKLIDPLLFSLGIEYSHVLAKPIPSPKSALFIDTLGQNPGERTDWEKYLAKAYGRADDPSKSEYRLFIYSSSYYEPDLYLRIPAEFSVNLEGSVTIESYINNLHPIDYSDFYPTIASAFSCILPLFEQTLTDIAHFQYSREFPVKESLPLRPITPYSLHGRRLQVVVEMANIVLTPNSPEYTGTTWCAGKIKLCTDEIIATGVYCYDSDNVTDGGVELREHLKGHGLDLPDSDDSSIEDVDEYISQEVGTVQIKPGRCMVYSNFYQSRDTKFKLCDTAKPGYRKLLKFYLVDPTIRVPSSAIIPPQQQNWWARQVRQIARFAELPDLVWDKIADYVDYPMSLKKGKEIRDEILDDDGDNEIYEPEYDSWTGYEVHLFTY